MRQEILEIMRSHIGDNRYREYDFAIDQDALDGKNEPFLWLVRDSGTSLAFLGETLERKTREECFRIKVFRDRLFPIQDILFWLRNKDSRVFYYDFLDLREIRKEDAEKLYLGMWNDRVERLREDHPEEIEALGRPIEIIRMYDCDRHLEGQLEFARSIGDGSLHRIIDRMRNHERAAVDHKVYLYKQGDRDFYFEEKINGRMVLNGGIIFHKNKSDNRWEHHT